ncbi:Forkhead box protein D2 [Marasmius crinis-equi]|uniref:Forkhead box protein D2 n=1 Tax=Marasmius crinis-equi TaxID=585013 RepID=A0ABR3EM58_9AGAR
MIHCQQLASYEGNPHFEGQQWPQMQDFGVLQPCDSHSAAGSLDDRLLAVQDTYPLQALFDSSDLSPTEQVLSGPTGPTGATREEDTATADSTVIAPPQSPDDSASSSSNSSIDEDPEEILRRFHRIPAGRPVNLEGVEDPPEGGKPALPLPALAQLAIWSSLDKRLKSREIVRAIQSRFEFFRHRDNSKFLAASVRHMLSLYSVFKKLPKDEGVDSDKPKDRGSYWGLDLEHIDGLKRVRKRNRRSQHPKKSSRRAQSEEASSQTETSSCSSPGRRESGVSSEAFYYTPSPPSTSGHSQEPLPPLPEAGMIQQSQFVSETSNRMFLAPGPEEHIPASFDIPPSYPSPTHSEFFSNPVPEYTSRAYIPYSISSEITPISPPNELAPLLLPQETDMLFASAAQHQYTATWVDQILSSSDLLCPRLSSLQPGEQALSELFPPPPFYCDRDAQLVVERSYW